MLCKEGPLSFSGTPAPKDLRPRCHPAEGSPVVDVDKVAGPARHRMISPVSNPASALTDCRLVEQYVFPAVDIVNAVPTASTYTHGR